MQRNYPITTDIHLQFRETGLRDKENQTHDVYDIKGFDNLCMQFHATAR